MSVSRSMRLFMPRKYCRCLTVVFVCLLLALIMEPYLFNPRSGESSDPNGIGGFGSGGARQRVMRDISPEDKKIFIAIGESSEYPSSWVKDKKDPFFNLVLVGDDKSPGQDGAKVVHVGDDVEISKRRFKENNFDTLASEKVPMDRRVKDLRHGDCAAVTYDHDLPTTSVIIIFYNEAPSALIRTVVSILLRTELRYLAEIILVDDHSSIPSINETLPKAVKALFPPLVKLTRNEKRLGLIKARMAGSDKAKGDVILFLDSHCEVGPGWLEPLLQRIKEDDRNVVMPSHDIITAEGFEFVGSSTVDNQGTFNWGLLHTWQGLPEFDRKVIKTKADPVRSPTMAGGLFAISRRWWEYLGKYDPGFEVWGGENVEISFKTWMCGGRLDIMPCSHVGHVFRGGSPYPGHVKNSMSINQKRVADVWLDEYAEIVYLRHPELRTLDAGNITDRVNLRKRLNCKSFKWFMENVQPDKYVPSLKLQASGGLKTSDGKCVDTMQQESGDPKIYPACHFLGSQNFQMTVANEIRNGVDICLEADIAYKKVVLTKCAAKAEQKWYHNGAGSMIQSKSDYNLCMASKGELIVLKMCDSTDDSQKFTFKDYLTS